MSRQNEIRVRLSDDEIAQLDELKPPGMPRAVYVRSLVHGAPEVTDVATREEALAILTAMAREGRVSAAIELARVLRGDAASSSADPLAEVDAIMRAKANGQ
ncbi:MAG: hypothetical protein AABM43_07905 [Actinomycetota bacterium]